MSERRQATYDLHLHTYWSYDALANPETHFARASELGLRCIAITEHHVLDSRDEVAAAAESHPDLRVIPAAELSVNTSIGAVDLLVYGFPIAIPPELQNVLDAYHDWQRAYGAAMCAGMQAIGYDFTDAHRAELLATYRPQKTLDVQGQTHVKNPIQRDYFIERGFVADDAEYRGLGQRMRVAGSPVPSYPAVDFVVPAVRAAGCLVAIAHPHGYFAQGDRARMDTVREECYLDGVECAHFSVPMEFTPIYRDYCVEHGLFSTAGTDCHTDDDVRDHLGRHGGEEEWLDEFLARLDG